MKLSGRNAIITGASRGFGRALALKFIAEGASVVMCARSSRDLERTAGEALAMAGPGQRVVSVRADVSKTGDVENLIETALRELSRIDVLVNNAGIYGPKGPLEEMSWRDWVDAVEINLLGTVYACRSLLPHFKKNGYGKIINLSGGGATAPLPGISAYAASKAAVVRFTETLAEECRGSGIDINAVAPGALNTRLLDEILEAGPEKVGRAFYEKCIRQRQTGGTPLSRGTELIAFLASAESDGITGRLISAVWDNWETLPSRRTELESSDIYTLRRIVPEDRGKSW
ncbi:MAG TPA: SDR family oxidoreductase [Bacillota bacterium]|nr:SDR family oxidoreductase [Bacillota bacterium]